MRKLTLACLVHVSVWAWAQDAAPVPAPVAPPAQIKLKATVAAPPGPDGKPGDVLTFGRGKRISHVGIYVGDGKMIHASTSQRRVVETTITKRSPLIRQWKGVRRLVGGAGVTMRDSLLAFADSLQQ